MPKLTGEVKLGDQLIANAGGGRTADRIAAILEREAEIALGRTKLSVDFQGEFLPHRGEACRVWLPPDLIIHFVVLNGPTAEKIHAELSLELHRITRTTNNGPKVVHEW